MITAFTAGELTLLDGPLRGDHIRVMVKDGAGAWQDMTDFSGEDWVESVELSDEIDQYASRGSVTFRSQIGSQKLGPLLTASGLNNPGGGYDPLLNVGREVRIDCAVTDAGDAPVNWRRIFEGFIDTTEMRGEIAITFRSRSARLLDGELEEDTIFPPPSTPAVAVEVVLQQMIDQVMGSGFMTLVTPVPTGRTFYHQWIPAGKLFDAMRKIALDIGGWDLRYRWNDSAGQFDLMLTEPDRTITTPVHTFSADQYLNVEELSLTVDPIINAVRVEWGTGNYYADADAASITKYGRRFKKFGQQAPNLRNTLQDATDFATASLSDLSEPEAVQSIENLFWPAVEVGDYYRWTANGTHYDTDREWAVVGFTHSFSASRRRTTIQVRGQPAGANKQWLRMPAVSPSPLGQVWYQQYQGENLFLVPGFDPNQSIAYTSDFVLSRFYIDPVLATYGNTLSASVQANSTAVTDAFRVALWFTDVSDVLIGSKYLGDYMIQTTANGGTFGRVHNVPVPSNAVKIHVGVEAEGTITGTATIRAPHLNVGPIAGSYSPTAALQAQVSLANFQEGSSPVGNKRYVWTRGADVVTVKVWERTSLPWPSISSTADTSLSVGTDQYDATIPSSGSTYVQFATVDSAAKVYLQQQDEILAPVSAATGSPVFGGNIEADISAGAVDLTVTVQGDSTAFNMDVEVYKTDKTGPNLLVSHTFTASGQSITKATYAGLGGRDSGETQWWLRMTPASGPELWTNFPNPFVEGPRIADGAITETKIDDNSISTGKIQANAIEATHISAGAVTAAKISVGTLAAITADLGDVVAGSVSISSGLGDLQFTDPTLTDVVGSVTPIWIESSPTFNYGVEITASNPAASASASLSVYATTGTGIIDLSADVVNVSSLTIDGSAVSFGANDSGGSGFRLVLVPNA